MITELLRLMMYLIRENIRGVVKLSIFSIIILGYAGLMLSVNHIEYERMYVSYVKAKADFVLDSSILFDAIYSVYPIQFNTTGHYTVMKTVNLILTNNSLFKRVLAECLEEHGLKVLGIVATRDTFIPGLNIKLTIIDNISLIYLTPYGNLVEGRFPQNKFEALAPAQAVEKYSVGKKVKLGNVEIEITGLYLYELGAALVVDAAVLKELGLTQTLQQSFWLYWVDVEGKPSTEGSWPSAISTCIGMKLLGKPINITMKIFTLDSLAKDGLRRYQQNFSPGSLSFLFLASSIVVFIVYSARVAVDIVSRSLKYLALMFIHGATYEYAILLLMMQAAVVILPIILGAAVVSSYSFTMLYPIVHLSPTKILQWLLPDYILLSFVAYLVSMIPTTIYIFRTELGVQLKGG